jgi:hypothetical protein
MAEPLIHSVKSCRFLYDIMVESEISGIPIGVAQRCLLIGSTELSCKEILEWHKRLDQAFLSLSHMIGQSYESEIRPSLTSIEHAFAHIRGCLEQENTKINELLHRLNTEEKAGLKRVEP